MKKKSVSQTYSPSMDIQISSNFERQMFYSLGNSSNKINNIFNFFNNNNEYQFDNKAIEDFQSIYMASSITDEETLNTIKQVYDKFNYTLL